MSNVSLLQIRSVNPMGKDTDAAKAKAIRALGLSIANQRRKRGLTLEKLAYGIGISKGNLSEIESGKRDPRYWTLSKIADGLDMPISVLLKGL
jgi:DNA-binding XRE family transcriptional regulator